MGRIFIRIIDHEANMLNHDVTTHVKELFEEGEIRGFDHGLIGRGNNLYDDLMDEHDILDLPALIFYSNNGLWGNELIAVKSFPDGATKDEIREYVTRYERGLSNGINTGMEILTGKNGSFPWIYLLVGLLLIAVLIIYYLKNK